MAGLRAAVTGSSAGFDASRSLLVLPLRGKLELYLVAGEELSTGLDTSICDIAERPPSKTEKQSTLLTAWERSQNIRVLKFTGTALGSSTFNAWLPNTRTPWITPLTIRVTADKDSRQVGEGPKGAPVIGPNLRLGIAGMPFREALVRLAEDQMNSAIGHQPKGGFGCYGLPAKDANGNPNNWCGAWVQWLYQRVSEIQGVANPFENNVNTLASPQKAIGFALHRTDKLTLIEFTGTDPFGWSFPPKKNKEGKAAGDSPALKAEYKGHTPVAGPPRRGDVCLVRNSADPAKGWKHVSMVLTTPDASGQFHTFDGNQGGDYDPRTKGQKGCIGTNVHNISTMAKQGGVKKFAFVAVNLPGDGVYVPKALPASLLGG